MIGQLSCDEPNNWLPIVTCVLSVLLTTLSVPLNGVVLLAIIKNKKFHTNFHFIIFNSTVADFLIGAVLCPLSIAIHANEIRNKPMDVLTQKVFHFGLFTLAMVSVLSITVLSVDRMISLKFSTYYRVMKKRNFLASLLGVWVIATSLSPIYFFIDYTLFLSIISVTAVLVTALMMFITYMFYRAQLRRAFIRSHSTAADTEEISEDQGAPGSIHRVSDTTTKSSSSIPMSIKRKFTRSKKESVSSITQSSTQKLDEEYQIYLMEKRATNTFFYMMIVFLLCYIPVVGISLSLHTYRHYRYSSDKCSMLELLYECIAILCIISSVCKTIVFLARLTALRKACFNLFISEEEMEKRWRKESVPMVQKKKVSLRDKLLRRNRNEEEEADDETNNVFT